MQVPLSTLFLTFLRLGLTSFGGPIAHLGYFRHDIVLRRRWLDDRAYADLVALCQFLPGPTSSQVGFALGLSRAGWPGALAAFAGFTLPSALLMVLFAGGSYWKIFPLRGLTSDDFDQLTLWGQVKDYLWHITLPVIAATISSFATLTLLTKNSFLDEINKQYVMTARAKGLTQRRVLYGHVFRNAMLIVIAGFPSLFLGVFFGSSILIETIFSLDGLGRLGFEAAVQRDYPVIFGTLYVFGLMGLLIGILSDLTYVLVDPRIDFEKRAG